MESRCNLISKMSKSQRRRRSSGMYSVGFLVSALKSGGLGLGFIARCPFLL